MVAIRHKDIDGILRHHLAAIVMFDVPPPFQTDGIDAYRQTWETFFSWSADSVSFRVDGMKIVAGVDVAFAFIAMRCRGPAADGRVEDLNSRLTIGLQNIGGQWTIVHEHHSVPAAD